MGWIYAAISTFVHCWKREKTTIHKTLGHNGVGFWDSVFFSIWGCEPPTSSSWATASTASSLIPAERFMCFQEHEETFFLLFKKKKAGKSAKLRFVKESCRIGLIKTFFSFHFISRCLRGTAVISGSLSLRLIFISVKRLWDEHPDAPHTEQIGIK